MDLTRVLLLLVRSFPRCRLSCSISVSSLRLLRWRSLLGERERERFRDDFSSFLCLRDRFFSLRLLRSSSDESVSEEYERARFDFLDFFRLGDLHYN